MNKPRLKLRKFFCLSGLAVLSIFFCLGISNYYRIYINPPVDSNVKYDIYGQDKYTYFGDGRFQMMNWASDVTKLKLVDFLTEESASFYLSRLVERYYLIDNLLYVEADFSQGTTDLKTGVRIYFDEQDDVPSYLVLNILSAEGIYYQNIEEMPQEYREVFNMPLTEDCKESKACYETGMLLYDNAFNPFD